MERPYRGEVAKEGEWYEFFSGSGNDVNSKGTLYLGGFGRSENVIYKLPVKEWGAWGPKWDLRDAKVVHRRDMKPFKTEMYNQSCYVDSNDNLFVPTTWSTSTMRNEIKTIPDTIFSLDPNGNERWTMAKPNGNGKNAYGASAIVGEWQFKGIGNVLCSWHWWWNFRPYFISSDGLYLGTALEETKIGPAALWSESMKYFLQRANGEAYMINSANQGLHFFKMKGFGNCIRFETTKTVSAADIARAKELASVKVKTAAPKVEIGVKAFAAGEVTIDGVLNDWRGAPWVKIDGGKGRAAKMALGTCGGKLLLAADVDDPTPMLQTGSDYRCLFITGDVVDIMFGTDKAANAHRKEATFGDLRVSISEMNGRPVVVVSEPKVKGFAGTGETLMAAKLDRVRTLANAEVRIVRRDKGYVVEAVEREGCAPTTGIFSTRYILMYLSEHGRCDLARKIVLH